MAKNKGFLNYVTKVANYVTKLPNYVTKHAIITSMKRINGQEYERWQMVATWGVIAPLENQVSKARRRPLPDELQAKRAAHMKKLHADGIPYAWIAALYKMTRTHVRRIINDIPNN